MPSTYSTDLRIELIANGEKTGTWGTITNDNLGVIIEDAISGLASVSVISADQALTAQNGAADQARCAAISLTTTTTAPFNVYVPPVTKLYVIENASSYTATIYASTVLGNTTAAGSGTSIPAGKSVLVRCDGTNVFDQFNHVVGNFSTGGNVTVTGDTVLSGALSVAKPVTVATSAFLGSGQTATISVAAPSIITVASAPASGTAVVFTTTDTLPTGLTVGTVYYVSNIDSTTFNVSTSPTLTPLVAVTVAGVGTQTVSNVSLALTPPAASNSTQIATTEYVTTAISNIPSVQTKTAVKAATTQNITLSGEQTIDGIALVAGDRVLVKDQFASSQTATITIDSPGVITVGSSVTVGTKVAFTTTGTLPTGLTVGQPYYVLATGTSFSLSLVSGGSAITTSGTQSGTHTLGVIPAATNGIYTVDGSTWSRTTDTNTATEIAAAQVSVLAGNVNGGGQFTTNFKSTDTLGATAMSWSQVVVAPTPIGTTGQVLTSDGSAAAWQTPATQPAIGVGQTWQSVSRSLGTTYTNSTGKPIMVLASVRCQGSSTPARAYVDGMMISNNYAADCCGVPQTPVFPLSFIVPDGSDYYCTGASLALWRELR